MKDEAAFKKRFKASVRAQGGFSISLAAPMMPGIPDLYCVMPGFAPVLLEAKWMKELPFLFNRKPKFTELQKHFIASCNKVHPGIAWGLIGGKYDKRIFACLAPPSMNIHSHYINSDNVSFLVKQSEFFDIRKLFELYVPRMEFNYAAPLTIDAKSDSVEVSTTIGDLVDTTPTLAVRE